MLPNHPKGKLSFRDGREYEIFVCGNCEKPHTILVLPGDGDRWLCTACRNEGRGKPVRVPVSNPVRKPKGS